MVVPAAELQDRETGVYLNADELLRAFDQEGVLGADRIITYCGGGIAASSDLFALCLIGREEKLSLYDGSLSEWAIDHSVPMET